MCFFVLCVVVFCLFLFFYLLICLFVSGKNIPVLSFRLLLVLAFRASSQQRFPCALAGGQKAGASARCFSQSIQLIHRKDNNVLLSVGCFSAGLESFAGPGVPIPREPSKARSRRSCWVADLGEGISPTCTSGGRARRVFLPLFHGSQNYLCHSSQAC